MIDHIEVYILRKYVFAKSFRQIWIDFIFVKYASLLVLFENRSISVDADGNEAWDFVP